MKGSHSSSVDIVSTKTAKQSARQRFILDAVANPILIKDENKKIIDCNSAFEKYFSVKRKTILTKTVFEIFENNFASQLNSLDDEILTDKSSKVKEILFENCSKEHYNLLITENLLIVEKNKPALVCELIDITNFKKELSLKSTFAKDQKNLDDIKTRLLSTSSHEFRTPLTTILIASEMLAMIGRTCSDQKYFEQIVKIQNSVTYMTGLLDEILTIDRTDKEVWKFNPSMINLDNFCRKMVEEVCDQATPQHNIKYEYLSHSKHAIVDDKLLQHILTNLLSNALKYSPDGGEIVFKVKQLNSTLEFTLSDKGIGIPDQEKENLFEPFYRCKNASKIKGTGLGLAIVKRSVESHGGEIIFESKIEEGTTFTVSIPLMTSI